MVKSVRFPELTLMFSYTPERQDTEHQFPSCSG